MTEARAGAGMGQLSAVLQGIGGRTVPPRRLHGPDAQRRRFREALSADPRDAAGNRSDPGRTARSRP